MSELLEIQTIIKNSIGVISPLRWREHILGTRLWNYIFDQTFFLKSNAKFSERIYCLENNITQKLTCKMCGQPLKFTRLYVTYCSVKCSVKNWVKYFDAGNTYWSIKNNLF